MCAAKGRSPHPLSRALGRVLAFTFRGGILQAPRCPLRGRAAAPRGHSGAVMVRDPGGAISVRYLIRASEMPPHVGEGEGRGWRAVLSAS